MKYSCLSDEASQMRSDRDSYQQKVIDKDDTITRLESSLSILNADRDKFVSTQNLFSRHVFALQKHIRGVKDDVLSYKKEILALLVDSQCQYSVFSSQIRTAVDKMREFYSLEYQRCQGDLDRLSLLLANAQRGIDEKTLQIGDQETKFLCLLDKNRLLILENTEMQHKLSDSVSSLCQREEVILMLKGEIAELTSSKNHHISEISGDVMLLRAENKQLQVALEELKCTNGHLLPSLDCATAEVQRLCTVVLEKDRLLEVCQDAQVIGEQQVQNYLRQIESMTKEREQEELLHKTQIATLVDQLQSRQIHSEMSRGQLEITFNAKLAEKDQHILQLRSNDEMRQKMLSEETREKEGLQNSLKDVRNEYSRLLEQMNESQKQFDLERKTVVARSEEGSKSLQELELEISEKENLMDKMEDDLIKKNREITDLKQMVQKECEERHELTEALNQARQQLLLMGDYHVPKVRNNLPPINSVKSTSSSASDKRSSTISIQEKRNSLDKFGGSSKNSIISTKRKLERLFNT